MTYVLFLAAVAPPLFLAYVIFKLNTFKQMKVEVCLRLFIYGGLIGIPIIFAEQFTRPILEEFTQSVFLTMLIGVALIEEFFKYLAVKLVVYDKVRFNAPIDGIVYTVMVGLGFALAENVSYVFSANSPEDGMGLAIGRMFTAIPAHALFGVFMGYFLGRAQLDKDDEVRLIILGLLSAILLHATYNSLAVEQPLYFAVILLVVAFFFAIAVIRKAQINSGLVPQDINSDIEPSSEYFSKALDEVEAGVECTPSALVGHNWPIA